MSQHSLDADLTLEIAAWSRPALSAALQRAGVQLNHSAERLLDDPVFDRPAPESISIVVRSVRELGLVSGAPLPDIFAAAQGLGLRLCPPTTGPYLRLAWLSQPNAPDTVLSNGRAPSGSLTVASAPLRDDVDYPKGFYLRVIEDRLWLRGYRCDDTHAWSPDDRFAFAAAD